MYISRSLLLGHDSILVSRDMTVELNIHSNVVPREFPRVEIQPIIWYLHLKPVDDLLLKDTISITQAISPGRVIQRGHTVEKTRSQSAETAIAESSVMLLRDDILNSKAEIFKTSYTRRSILFLKGLRI